MSAPTEAEIREAITYRMIGWPADRPQEKLKTGCEDLADFLTGPAFAILESPDPIDERDLEGGDIWSPDLRPSEAMRLRELGQAAIGRALARCIEVATDELVAAALAFAAEYPDAPRAAAREAVA